MAATDSESGIYPKDFIKAVLDGDLTILKSLVSETGNDKGNGNGGDGLIRAYEKVKVIEGRNGLHLAAAVGHVEICKYLVHNLKFDIDTRDYLGSTPLMVAIMKHCHPTAVYLIKNGAGIGCVNFSGFTPLHCAAQTGQREILRLLLAKGAKIIDLSPPTGTPLNLTYSTDCVKILLQHGADVNFVTKLVASPLMKSILDVSYERMELLLKAGADPNLGYFGRTPLISAAHITGTRFIKRLLKAGANPNLVDTVEIRRKNSFKMSKAKGREAFERKDYEDAIHWYTQASGEDPTDATIFSNRSLCWLKLNLGCLAEADAKTCVALKPDWPKAHYREGAALMLLQEYLKASEAFSKALKLEPNNAELKKAHREAVEADLRRPLSEKIRHLQV